MLPVLPKQVMEIIWKAQADGGQAYVVGGALRSLLLGNAPKDWDFAVTLPTDDLLKLYSGAVLIGGHCGTIKVPMGNGHCEITPCRTEGAYTDQRHPDTVEFVPDIMQDLARRDFTVNAMAYNGAILLDPFGGQRDLAAGILRCVGEPSKRFEEDPLRILRLFRFSAILGFRVEWHTFCAANKQMNSISTLSPSRIRSEIEQILLSPSPQVLGHLINKGGLCSIGISKSTLELFPLAKMPEQLLFRWWGLLQLCELNRQLMKEQMGFSRRFVAQLEEISRFYHIEPAENKIQLKEKIRNSKLDYGFVTQTLCALTPAFCRESLWFAEIMKNKEPYYLKDLAINGKTLLQAGIKEKQCGAVLDALLLFVIQNPECNQEKFLLQYAEKWKGKGL